MLHNIIQISEHNRNLEINSKTISLIKNIKTKIVLTNLRICLDQIHKIQYNR